MKRNHIIDCFKLAAVAMVLSLGAQAAETIKVGHLPVTSHAKFFIAKEEGFFKDEGLDVELVEFANSADGLAALRAGKLGGVKFLL